MQYPERLGKLVTHHSFLSSFPISEGNIYLTLTQFNPFFSAFIFLILSSYLVPGRDTDAVEW